jgi:hypothetical protein
MEFFLCGSDVELEFRVGDDNEKQSLNVESSVSHQSE